MSTAVVDAATPGLEELKERRRRSGGEYRRG
jgi:hypothetical protein